MKRGVWFGLSGVFVLVALAGCGRGFMHFGEREPWRRDAEIACLKSGDVKLGAGAVQIKPIEGPGICGADFPLKVSA
ncbi:MAG TPA: extensin, partial [Pseudolabrys sp.]|nr:extensin [Pseudolabrys sp.]